MERSDIACRKRSEGPRWWLTAPTDWFSTSTVMLCSAPCDPFASLHHPFDPSSPPPPAPPGSHGNQASTAAELHGRVALHRVRPVHRRRPHSIDDPTRPPD